MKKITKEIMLEKIHDLADSAKVDEYDAQRCDDRVAMACASGQLDTLHELALWINSELTDS